MELLLAGQVASICSFLHNDVLPARPSNVKCALLSSTSLRIIGRLGHKLAFSHSEDLLTGVMDDPATVVEWCNTDMISWVADELLLPRTRAIIESVNS
jgi:hypothetical protein